ncbi:MAG: ABC transporter ATP-binding protein [Rhizobiales bacterium]|nr:ABC transporter ATP-binding protein [Hyphomicrobiales bacterium]
MIRLERLTKTYGALTAVDAVDMTVGAGEVCVLLGPSGCGKTTTMRMINRLVTPTSGKIFIDGKDTSSTDEVQLRRSIGYVIQQIGLFPNKTIEDNICVVPDLLGWDRAKSRKRAAELLDLVNLNPGIFLKRYPKQLSGGQQQRVGVIRALAADPPVLLMDEPFGAIDPINREVIQDEFMKLQASLKKTVVFVSHDIDEAVKMANRIAIFRDGKLVQCDTPDTILAHPLNAFVADFVGSDRALKRLRLMSVANVMQADCPTLKAGDSFERAAKLAEEHDLDGLPVVDDEGHPIGMLRFEIARGRNGHIAEHLESLPASVRTSSDVRTAVSLMFANAVTWLACVDESGKLKGYITQRAITNSLSLATGHGK